MKNGGSFWKTAKLVIGIILLIALYEVVFISGVKTVIRKIRGDSPAPAAAGEQAGEAATTQVVTSTPTVPPTATPTPTRVPPGQLSPTPAFSADGEEGYRIDEETFPDGWLRDALRNLPGGEDGFFTYGEIRSIRKLKLEGDIRSLEGLELLSELEKLEIDGCPIEEFHIGRMTDLRELSCKNCRIRILDVSYGRELRKLNCENNPITELDVSTNVLLRTLRCGHTDLEKLVLPSRGELRELYIDYTKIRKLDFLNLQSLGVLSCEGFSRVDISQTKSISRLYVSSYAEVVLPEGRTTVFRDGAEQTPTPTP